MMSLRGEDYLETLLDIRDLQENLSMPYNDVYELCLLFIYVVL